MHYNLIFHRMRELFNASSYPFLDFGLPFKFFAIRLNGDGDRLNT